MAKLQLKDLTPELLAEVRGCNNVDEAVKFFADKGFEVSPKVAERILEECKKENTELTDEELAAIAGGGPCGGGNSSNGTHS